MDEKFYIYGATDKICCGKIAAFVCGVRMKNAACGSWALDIYEIWKIKLILNLSRIYLDIDYASNLFAPVLPNFSVNKKRSNKGVNLKTDC